jgi:outer membrane receptor protein involved in Fe transport
VKEDRYGMPGGRWPGQDRRRAANPGDYAETQTTYLRLTPRFKLDDDTHLDLGLEYGETEPMWQSVLWGGGKSRILEYALKPKLTSTREILGLEHELTAGVDFTTTGRHPQQFSIFAPEYDITRTEAGYYLADTIALVPEKVFLDVGYRRSHVSYHYADPAVGNAAYDLNSFRFGLTYAYAPKSKLFISADRSFRTMLLSELGGPWGAPVALPPQTSWTYQAGARHFFNRYITLGATVFEIDTADEIFYDPNSWQNSNYPKTVRRGIELSAESNPLDTLRLYANYTWMDPRLQGGAYDGNRIPGVAMHTVQTGATWSPLEQIDLDVRARWLDSRLPISDWGNSGRDWEGNSFTVVDAKLTYKPAKWLKLYVGCNNLFNEAYSEYGTWAQNWGKGGVYEPYTYPSPKRNFIAGVVITKEF